MTRHRLDRGGNRQANCALHRIVLVRIAHDPDTRRYFDRRVKEGRSKLEVMRILKRYVARDLSALAESPERSLALPITVAQRADLNAICRHRSGSYSAKRVAS